MEGGLQANRLQNFSLVENKFDFSTTFTLVCRGPNILSEVPAWNAAYWRGQGDPSNYIIMWPPDRGATMKFRRRSAEAAQ